MRDHREWRERFDREQRQFDRMFRWLFPIALVLGLVFALVELALWAGAATWLWSVIP